MSCHGFIGPTHGWHILYVIPKLSNLACEWKDIYVMWQFHFNWRIIRIVVIVVIVLANFNKSILLFKKKHGVFFFQRNNTISWNGQYNKYKLFLTFTQDITWPYAKFTRAKCYRANLCSELTSQVQILALSVITLDLGYCYTSVCLCLCVILCKHDSMT